MHCFKTTLIVLATLSIGGASTALGGRDFAENSYQEGVELMNSGRHYEAIDRFDYAIKSAKRKRQTPPGKYFVKRCEATSKALDMFRVDQWKKLVGVCDEAIAKSSGAEKKSATRHRRTMARTLAAKAAKRGKTAAARADHEGAQKWYRLAIKLDSRASYTKALCASHAVTGPTGAPASCRLASSEPTAGQKKTIVALEKALWQVTGYNSTKDARRCLDLVAEARQAGVKDNLRVTVNHDFPGATMIHRPGHTPDYVSTFGRVEPVCIAILEGVLIPRLARALESAQHWADGISTRDMNQLTVASITVEQCRAAVTAALEGGLEPETSILYRGRKVTVARADAVVCTPIENKAATRLAKLQAEAAARRAAQLAQRAARLAPYKKVLRGDKWKLYEEYEGRFQGRGGRNLETPAQLKRAKKWFLVSTMRDPETRLKSWTVTGYVFRGHKLVRTTSKSGWSPAPPSSAFR